jgi:2-keto-4-pentenoate hydratase
LLNITLKKGEFVTTGTTTTPMAILPGDKIEADFGTLGKISSHLSEI